MDAAPADQVVGGSAPFGKCSVRQPVLIFKHESRVQMQLAYAHRFRVTLYVSECTLFLAINRSRLQVYTKLMSPDVITIHICHYSVCAPEISCIVFVTAFIHAANEMKQIMSLITLHIISHPL